MDKSLDRHLFDRRLYLAAAIGFAVIVFVGFGPTYYVKGLFDSPPLPSGLVHLHGLLMTMWVVLFVTQVQFIASKQVRLHQRLGYAGVVLSAFIIITGVPTALRAAKYGTASAPPGIPPLEFLLLPMSDLLVFALLFGAAVYYRRRPAAHKSLMLLTAINFIPPAVARVPVPSLQALGPLWFFGVPTVIALLCLGLDARRYGRVNRVFLTGTLLLIGSFVIRLMVMSTGAWTTVAAWLITFV